MASVSFGSPRISQSQSYIIEGNPSPSIEVELQKLKQDLALLKTSQQMFYRTIRNRKCGGEITSCCCCPITFIATLIPFLLCYPCNCYLILSDKEDYFSKTMDFIGCGLDRPPENRRELCCIYCTPLYLDLPDLNTKNGPDFYTLPIERAEERNRRRGISELAETIKIMQSQIEEQNRAPPRKEEMD